MVIPNIPEHSRAIPNNPQFSELFPEDKHKKSTRTRYVLMLTQELDADFALSLVTISKSLQTVSLSIRHT